MTTTSAGSVNSSGRSRSARPAPGCEPRCLDRETETAHDGFIMNTQPRPQTSGVIFDLDGTLADTLEDITDSINIVFAETGHESVSRERVRGLIGEGLGKLLQLASGLDVPDRVDGFIERYREVYRGRMLVCTRLFPGVSEMLDALVRLEVPLAVRSTKPEEFTLPICETLLSRWPFVRVRGPRSEALRKPDPTQALEVAAEMDRPPSAVFFIGDSVIDIGAAHNAGMRAVAVTWGYRDFSELDRAKPEHLIDRPASLIDIVR